MTTAQWLNKKGTIILGYWSTFKPGDIVRGVFDSNSGEYYPNQKFLIVREATEEEYKEQLSQAGISITRSMYSKFYEVTTD